MGISCAPLLANLLLMTYEYKFMENLEKDDKPKAQSFNYTFRYIDDLISFNNPDFPDHVADIYPEELSIKQENTHFDKASCLDLYIEIIDRQFHTKLYDKRDSFDFDIVNYPFVEKSNIPENPAYGVYSSRLVCIARACDSDRDFIERHDALCIRLMRQGFRYKKLVKQLNKSLNKHKDLFSKYQSLIEVPLPIRASNVANVTIR